MHGRAQGPTVACWAAPAQSQAAGGEAAGVQLLDPHQCCSIAHPQGQLSPHPPPHHRLLLWLEGALGTSGLHQTRPPALHTPALQRGNMRTGLATGGICAASSHRKQQQQQCVKERASRQTMLPAFRSVILESSSATPWAVHCKDCSGHSSSQILSPDSQQAPGSLARRRSSSPCTPGPTRISSRRSPRSQSSCAAGAMTCAGSRHWSLRAAGPVYCCAHKLTARRAGMASGLRSQCARAKPLAAPSPSTVEHMLLQAGLMKDLHSFSLATKGGV